MPDENDHKNEISSSPHELFLSPSATVNYVTLDGPGSRSIRTAVRQELEGRVLRDDPSVFERLGIHLISDEAVEACLEKYNLENKEAIEQLIVITEAAERVQKLPNTLLGHGAIEQVEGQGYEVQMYPHLQSLLHYIVNFDTKAKKCREILLASGMNLRFKREEHTSCFPHFSPNGIIGDIASIPDKDFENVSWRILDAFVEVKPTEHHGKPSKDSTVAEIVCQGADYARLHMCGRPFQLFSVGLLVYSTFFTVGIFDRDGVVLSPASSIVDNPKDFIKVIRRLVSADLSGVALGHDPTVSMLPADDSRLPHIRKKAAELGIPKADLTFPSYSVLCYERRAVLASFAHEGPGEYYATKPWITIGPPLWNSVSLIGRGCSVWRVARIDKTQTSIAQVYILKNAWRSDQRSSESSLYRGMGSQPDGVAAFSEGDDVIFPGTQVPISAHHLRSPPAGTSSALQTSDPFLSDDSGATAILHRLVLSTIGRPLWYFVDYLDLFKGFRAALVGHQSLYRQGILHRDISAGNVLLSAVPDPPIGKEGFLMDLEFASVDQDATVAMQSPRNTTHIRWSKAKRGAQMTGTVQFMACEILSAVSNQSSIEHQVHHDLESFCWVIGYTVARRLLRDCSTFPKADKTKISNHFASCFGKTKLADVLTSRRSLEPLYLSQLTRSLETEILPQPVTAFFEVLRRDLRALNEGPPDDDALLTTYMNGINVNLHPPPQLTHERILTFINMTIAGLTQGS